MDIGLSSGALSKEAGLGTGFQTRSPYGFPNSPSTPFPHSATKIYMFRFFSKLLYFLTLQLNTSRARALAWGSCPGGFDPSSAWGPGQRNFGNRGDYGGPDFSGV